VKRGEQGFAMVTVLALMLIMSVLVVTIFSIVTSEQKGVVRQRNVTSARQAAEAGIDELVWKMGQSVSGVSNWDSYPTTYAGANSYTYPVGDGTFAGNVALDPTDASRRIITMKGTYGGRTRTVVATVRRQSPAAFDYSMFASTKIQIHNHGGWLSPDVVTTKIHSNGDITLDGPSQYRFDTMTAVNSIIYDNNFNTKTPDGVTIPTTGYNYTYNLPSPALCFPGRTVGACTASSPKYAGFVALTGNVAAKSVTVDVHGQSLIGPAVTTVTGQTVPASLGTVKASTAKIGGLTLSTPGTYTSANCANCGKGSSTAGGQTAGPVTIASGYAPAVVPFPALNYQQTYKVRAQGESGTHVFTSPTTFLDYVTTVSNGMYRKVDSSGNLSAWSASDGAPGVLLLDGDWYLTSGNLSLTWSDMLTRVKAKTGISTITKPPVIVIRGSLVNETGGLDFQAPVAVVGPGNDVNFVLPGPAFDMTRFLSASATEPGVVAAGGDISGNDCDTDTWNNAGSYEPLKTCPIYIRGLVYSASYNTTSKTATPQNQHWHNEDPKNQVRIFGAQVGDTLHDCSTFSFTYDPLVKKAFGFSGSGQIEIVDFRETGV
jgi:hypothetical protein